MSRRLFLLSAAALASAALLLPASAAAQTKLVGTVGPGFTITLTMGGKRVTTLRAGTYTITVRDRSDFHNFHLKGAGVNKDSGVDAVGTKTWRVSLRKGSRYTFVCDPHDDSMRGSFRVT